MEMTYDRLASLVGMHGNGASPLSALMGMKLAARIGIKIVRLMKKLTDEAELLRQQMQGLQEQYGADKILKEMKGKPPVEIAEALPEEYTKEVDDLLASTVNVEIEPVLLPQDADVTPALLMELDGIVEVDG